MMTSSPTDRLYLHVPPEEYAEVAASGAAWDDSSKRWYVPQTPGPSAGGSRWKGEPTGDTEFALESGEARVAVAETVCVRCGESIEVICIFCETGMDVEMEQSLTEFTVSQVWAMDEALTAQLARWPMYRRTGTGTGSESEFEVSYFANHCPHCGAMQEDYRLHTEPGDVFFGIAQAEPGAVALTALEGRVRLSGDCGFVV